MTTYLTLRLARIFMWGGFLLFLAAANAWRGNVTLFGELVRYAPPVLLLLALIVGFAERLYRRQHGFAAIPFGRA